MCKQHTFFATVRRGVSDSGNKLLSKEFTGLELKDTECGEEPFHCEDCIHLVRGIAWQRILLGIAVFSLSLILVPGERAGMKWLGTLTGAALTSSGVYSSIRNKKRAVQSNLPLPVLPRIEQVQVQETLLGRISLNAESDYDVTVQSATGSLEIDLKLQSIDRDRLQKYTRKYDAPKEFHAGFAVLKGLAGFRIGNTDISIDDEVLGDQTVVPLIDLIDTQPFLKGNEQRDAETVEFRIDYDLEEVPQGVFFPIQLFLSFLSGSDRRGIELGVQWIQPEFFGDRPTDLWKLKPYKIESLKLIFPASWGRVLNLSDSDCATVSQEELAITWRQVQIAATSVLHLFKIKFENAIEPQESAIEGQVKVSFRGTISGLEGVQLYFPTGNPGKPLQETSMEEDFSRGENLKIRTDVTTDFQLSLVRIRYQHTKVIPDAHQDRNTDRQGNLVFDGVSPDYETIVQLTDAMSDPEQGFYVRQIIEERPTINAEDRLLDRRWRISGRWYEGVYPIDFQVFLRGQERSNLSHLPLTSNAPSKMTTVNLSVQGTYSNVEMEDQIEGVWDNLKDLICEIFQPLPEEGLYLEQEALSPSLDRPPLLMEATFEDGEASTQENENE